MFQYNFQINSLHTPTVLEPGKARALDSRDTIAVPLEVSGNADSTFKQSIASRNIDKKKTYNVFIFLGN